MVFSRKSLYRVYRGRKKGRADCINLVIVQVYLRRYFQANVFKYITHTLDDMFGMKLVRKTRIIMCSIWEIEVVLTRFYLFLPKAHTTKMPKTNKMLPGFHWDTSHICGLRKILNRFNWHWDIVLSGNDFHRIWNIYYIIHIWISFGIRWNTSNTLFMQSLIALY